MAFRTTLTHGQTKGGRCSTEKSLSSARQNAGEAHTKEKAGECRLFRAPPMA
jgi:hypothetical protein